MDMRFGAFVAAAVIGVAGTAWGHAFPAKAKSIKSALVQNYPACTSPDTQTTANQQACLGAEEVDPSCLFGSKGNGTLSATISKQSIKLSGALHGLDPLCEGKTLAPTLTVRTTTDSCATDHCTVVDQEITGGTCTVKKGSCTFNTTIASGFDAGAGSEMTILACGVKNGSLQTFACGIMVK